MRLRPLAAATVLCVSTLGLAACGSDDVPASPVEAAPTSAAPTPTGSASPTTTPTADGVVINSTLTGSKVSPAPGRIKVSKGDKVTINITRDSAGEIHVHGYDLEEQAKANVPVKFTFVADQEGLFEVEAHDPDLLLFQLQVS